MKGYIGTVTFAEKGDRKTRFISVTAQDRRAAKRRLKALARQRFNLSSNARVDVNVREARG